MSTGVDGFGNLPQPSATFGNLRQPSATFRNLRQPSATFRNLPQPSATFRNLPQPSVDCTSEMDFEMQDLIGDPGGTFKGGHPLFPYRGWKAVRFLHGVVGAKTCKIAQTLQNQLLL